MKTVFPFISWAGTAALVTQPDPQFWVMLGVLITSIAGLISSYMASRREDRRHEWEREERESYRQALARDVKNVATVTLQAKEEIRSDVSHNTKITEYNTEITKSAAEKADLAYEAANHVNDKIARLASDQAVKRIEEKALDTNETAHRIEGKL